LTKDDGQFKCVCSTGFKGRRCEIPPFTTMTPTSSTTEKLLLISTEEAEEIEATTQESMTHLNETMGSPHRDYLEEDFEGADDIDNEA
jgi:hypothetical protein